MKLPLFALALVVVSVFSTPARADECLFGTNGTDYGCFYETQRQGKICASEYETEPCVTIDNHHLDVFPRIAAVRDALACISVHLTDPLPCLSA